MADFDYDGWWALHLRTAKGEALTAEETAAYVAGLERFDQATEGIESDTVAYLRSLRAAIDRALGLHAELTARSAELDSRIVALESNYQRLTGHSLRVTPHAPA